MSHLSALRAVGVPMFILLLAACAVSLTPAAPSTIVTPSAPTATSAPPTATPHPFAGLAEWDVVVIGDSSLWGVAEPYAQFIEQARGVKVLLHDEWQGGLSAGTILKALRGDFEHSAQREKWPQLIRGAEVLVLFGNPTDSLSPDMTETAWHCVDLTDPGQVEIPADAFARYRADLGAIYDEIAGLRAGRPLILRAVGIYNPALSVWREKGFADVCEAFWEGQNDAVRNAAEENGVQFVDTYAAFNGPSHDQDPRTRGFIREDGEHPSEAGAQFYAELLRQSGYDTWSAGQP